MLNSLLASPLLAPMFKLAEQGGSVIFLLAALAVVLWLFIIERFISLYFLQGHQLHSLKHYWRVALNEHSDTPMTFTHWQYEQLQQAFLSDYQHRTRRYLTFIKTCISICPLLGLLGTVVGMIAVFDVIATTGTSDAKAMAGGIFKATLPTMTGLFFAVTALYFHYLLVNKAEQLQLQARELCHAS